MDSIDNDTGLNIMRQEAKMNIPSTSGHMFEPTPPPNLLCAELLDEMDPTPNQDFQCHVAMMSSPPSSPPSFCPSPSPSHLVANCINAKIVIPSSRDHWLEGKKKLQSPTPNLPRAELLDEMDPTPNRDFQRRMAMLSEVNMVTEGINARIVIPRSTYHWLEGKKKLLPPTPYLPHADLLVGSREANSRVGAPLYKALVNEDWQAAMAILDGRPELVRCAITENDDTALHFAASAEHTKLMIGFVEDLMNRMEEEDLELQNKDGNTAFCFAVAAGNVEIAQIMVTKNPNVLNIAGSDGLLPLHMGALFGKHDVVKYLYDNSWMMTHKLSPKRDWGWVLVKCVEAEMFDVAIQILKDGPKLVENTNVSSDVLRVLAETPIAFSRTEHNTIWKIINSIFAFKHQEVDLAENDSDALRLLRLVCENVKELHMKEFEDILKGPRDSSSNTYSSRILFIAAEKGNTRFIIELIRVHPYLIWLLNDNHLTIFHMAVMHRHADIYNLLYEVGPMKQLITQYTDEGDNNMLHLVGKTSKTMRHQAMSGASLLLQRELLWFKEIEKIVHPDFRKRKNKDSLTPYALFSENNKDLVSQGLKWMKDCMVVATLIVTVAFAVAFTVPGGYNQDNGIPMFIHEGAFIVFVIADAISLCFSSASLLVFLSILTSRYGERDFLYSLPRRLMIGLVTLFISVAAMMVTFGASFFVLYRHGLKWVPILISVLAAIPVLLFARLQYPLLVDMFRSTYDATYLFRPKKRMVDNLNPWF